MQMPSLLTTFDRHVQSYAVVPRELSLWRPRLCSFEARVSVALTDVCSDSVIPAGETKLLLHPSSPEIRESTKAAVCVIHRKINCGT